MQVPRPAHQHETMIEAVENHNPEVIVIDEIGREREAAAARTINERGVQLIGTAHGNTLENLLLNPTLSDLVGGIESVTLSDEEARRRGTQKTVLERRAPPTFDVLIEIQDRQQLLAHLDVTTSVDAMLRGQSFPVELRSRNDAGEIGVEQQNMIVTSSAVTGRRDSSGGRSGRGTREAVQSKAKTVKQNGKLPQEERGSGADTALVTEEEVRRSLNVYAYGVARNRLRQAARRLKVFISMVDDLADADVLVTLKSYYRKRRQLISDAERQRIPVYILRANTSTQMEHFLVQALALEVEPSDPFDEAIAEAERAIKLVNTGQPGVNLNPVGSAIRRYQHQMARRANLVSHSYGKEPRRYVRIFKERRN